MKKHGLTKILAVILLIVVLLSWVVKGRSDAVAPIALGDVVMNYFQSFYYFDVMLFILVVGGFYGLLEHVDGYKNLISKIANGAKKKKLVVFIITIVFALLSSLAGLNLILLIFIPFAISLVIALGYDKIVALFSTVGAVAVGMIGGIFTTIRISSSYYGVSYTTYSELVGLEDKWAALIPNIILFVLALIILIVFLNLRMNKVQDQDEEVEEKEEKKITKKEEIKEEVKVVKEETKAPKKETKTTKTTDTKTKKNTTSKKKAPAKSTKKTTKKNLSAAKKDDTIVIKKDKKGRTLPLIIIMLVLLVLLVLGYLPWNSLFGISVFDDFHTWLTEIKIGDYALFTSIISSNITAFGNWANLGSTYIIAMLLIVVITIIIKFVYKIKFNDIFDYYAEGMKKTLPAILLIMLAYTVLVCTYNNGFMETIISSASDALGDNPVINALIAIVGSVLNVDILYVSQGIFAPIVNALPDTANLKVYAVLFQGIYGLVQIIGPTSILMITCLSISDVSYKDWFKNIWKFVLILLLAVFAAAIIAGLM